MKYRKFLSRLSGVFLAAVMAMSVPAGNMMVYADNESSIVTDVSFAEAENIVSGVTLEEGSLDPEIVNISVDAGNQIDSDVSAYNATVFSNSDSSHDWASYVSDTLPSRLSESELSMYEACDAMLLEYLNNSGMDAVKFTTSSYSYYVTGSIDFKQYGLTKQQAFSIAQMFLYNNPQYYFTSSVFLTTSEKIWFTVYDQFSDGDIRANYTDQVFTTLDKWIVSCSDYQTTTYMKELSVHDKICDVVDYISGTYDQSIYSTLIENKTVCAGYSTVFTMMMNAMDIDTMTVLSDCHAWNVVQLNNGSYYCVDTTWDDSLGGRYLFNVSESNLMRYDTAAKEHTISSGWSENWVPKMSLENYVPSYYDTTGFEGDGSVALSAPSNLSGTYDQNTDVIRVEWTEVAGASAYEVEVYNQATNKRIGASNIIVNHIRVGSASKQNMLIKIRAVGNNNGNTCYSEWSKITYIDGRFSAYREDNNVVLSAPANFRVSNQAEKSFDLNWDKVDNASGYGVFLYSDSDRQNKLASITTIAAGVHVNGISNTAPVYAYVRAFKSISGVTYYSEWSVLTIKSVSDGTLTLGKPTGVSYEKLSDSSGRVSWTPGSNSVSTNVSIRLASSSGKQIGSLSTAGTAFSLTGLQTGKVYYVGLQSVGQDGKTSQWVYTKLNHSTSGLSDSTDTSTKVTIPETISYESISETSGRVVWAAVSSASKYEVQIGTGSDFNKIVGQLNMTGTSVKITGLKAGTTYYARVRAIGSDGTLSGWKMCTLKSSGSEQTTDKTETIVPAPTGLSVSPVETKSRLSWNRVENAEKYTVEIYSDAAYQNKMTGATVLGSSILINGMSSGKTYYFRVNAISEDNTTSAWATYSYKQP